MTREELLQQAKPILFNTEMVRGILDGRKTVTRRVIKLPEGIDPYRPEPAEDHYDDLGEWDFLYGIHDKNTFMDCSYAVKAPYKVGDILYVRETWSRLSIRRNVGYVSERFVYRASDTYPFGEKYIVKFRWRPSIHMPKEAARIFLRVTDVRVEQLKEMTASDAMNEGFTDWNDFVKLWDSTIKKKDLPLYGWEANPWVFVIRFEKLKYEGDSAK